MDLDKLDIILEMDFLTEYHATLDCSNKEEVFKKHGEFEVKFIGDKKVNLANMISIVKARKLLISKSFNTYLSRIFGTRAKIKDPKSVSIICE